VTATQVRARVWIRGRVQGVNFRAFAEDEARFRKVRGWVRNLPDGRVEAALEGSPAAVDAMIRWCHVGSPAAEVASVEVRWEPPEGERGFRVRQ